MGVKFLALILARYPLRSLRVVNAFMFFLAYCMPRIQISLPFAADYLVVTIGTVVNPYKNFGILYLFIRRCKRNIVRVYCKMLWKSFGSIILRCLAECFVIHTLLLMRNLGQRWFCAVEASAANQHRRVCLLE